MNLRFSSKGVRLRISQEELAGLSLGRQLGESIKLPDERHLNFRLCVVAGQSARFFSAGVERELALIFEITENDLAALRAEPSRSLTLTAGALIEIDAFNGERRSGKEKRHESVLATNHTR